MQTKFSNYLMKWSWSYYGEVCIIVVEILQLLGAGYKIAKDIESFECIKIIRNNHNHKHLWENWTPKIGLSNTSDL